jgi:hypothetical protein
MSDSDEKATDAVPADGPAKDSANDDAVTKAEAKEAKALAKEEAKLPEGASINKETGAIEPGTSDMQGNPDFKG